MDMVNQFRCQCVPGFIGAYCENKVGIFTLELLNHLVIYLKFTNYLIYPSNRSTSASQNHVPMEDPVETLTTTTLAPAGLDLLAKIAPWT